jgi:hypothetical protein
VYRERTSEPLVSRKDFDVKPTEMRSPSNSVATQMTDYTVRAPMASVFLQENGTVMGYFDRLEVLENDGCFNGSSFGR